MKLFKKISAIVLATAMFGMSAMAAGIITLPSKVEVESGATQVTLTMSVDEGTTMGAFAASYIIYFDSDIFTYNADLSTCGYGAVDNDPNADACIMWGTSANVTTTADNTTLASYVFDIKDGADANGAVFTLSEDEWGMYIDENFSDMIAFPENSEVTVEVKTVTPPAPPVEEEPETGDIVDVDGKTAVIDDQGNTRFVVTAENANVGNTTAASVLKVTYAGTTKQANLWKLLKVEEGATGEIEIGNLTVKVILGTDVTDANSVGSLSIAVQ